LAGRGSACPLREQHVFGCGHSGKINSSIRRGNIFEDSDWISSLHSGVDEKIDAYEANTKLDLHPIL
jgi:hypothetical protein